MPKHRDFSHEIWVDPLAGKIFDEFGLNYVIEHQVWRHCLYNCRY